MWTGRTAVDGEPGRNTRIQPYRWYREGQRRIAAVVQSDGLRAIGAGIADGGTSEGQRRRIGKIQLQDRIGIGIGDEHIAVSVHGHALRI